MISSAKKIYALSIYSERVLNRAVEDYKGIAIIKKRRIQDKMELSFRSRYPLDTVVGEFDNYLIQLLNQNQA